MFLRTLLRAGRRGNPFRFLYRDSRRVLVSAKRGIATYTRRFSPHGLWDAVHVARDGTILWEDREIHNIWHRDGEEWVVKALFVRTTGGPAPFDEFRYGLDARSTLGEADNLGTVAATEPQSGGTGTNGYIRPQIVTTVDGSQFTATPPGTEWQATGPSKAITASGGPIPATGNVNKMFLTDKNLPTITGQFLISSAALSGNRTLQDGETLNIKMDIPIKEPA